MKQHLMWAAALSLFAATVHGDAKTAQKQMPEPPRLHSDVYLKSPAYSFEVMGSALFLQPTGSDLHYAAEAYTLPAQSPHWKIHEIKTDYQWGFDVGLRGNFRCAHTNLSLNWERIHTNDSASRTTPPANMIGPFFEIGPDAMPYSKAHGKVKFQFDEANLNYGIYLHLGNRLQTNLSSGVQFARIYQKLSTRYSSSDGSTYRTIKTPSTFTGAGPNVGMEFNYRIVAGFNLVGRARASLLVGQQKNNTKFQSNSPLLVGLGYPSPNNQKINQNKKTQLVPGFEGSLGLCYDFMICDHYLIRVEAGYQAQTYLNAIQSIDIGSEVVTPPVAPDIVGVFARTFEETLSNFSLAGAYFKLDFGF